MKIGLTFDLKSTGPKTPGIHDDADEEFDSPQTIESIANVLHGLGHAVVFLGDGREFLEKVLTEKPDFVFNFAEGRGVSRSREARVPAVLEMLGIPFTGSDPFTMAATLDKDCAKKLVAHADVAVPTSYALDPAANSSSIPIDQLRFPLVVKPAWEGSSKGIRNRCFVKDPEELPGVIDSLRRSARQTILLEEYIAGDEVTVGLIGNAPPSILGMMRIIPNTPSDHFIYSLEIKRDFRKLVTYQCPPPLTATTLDAIAASAQTVFRTLACRDVARIDFRIRDGVPYFLEVNPLPGLHPADSDLVIMAGLVGWSYEKLVSSIVQAAMKRCGLS
ncbi:MAG: ATP-grasp domain-containing protein [Planctomycetes bacterium]|nr:ATP-grasp domain-containing protein [Planctomycetota bacterium]